MSKEEIKIYTPEKYKYSDFFHNAIDFARPLSLNTNELCLEMSAYYHEHKEELIGEELKQLAELKSENEKLQRRLNLTTKYKDDVKEDRTKYIDKVKELQQQLKEKEQEHELLINDFERETENLRKQIKQESDARKRFVEAIKEKDEMIKKLFKWGKENENLLIQANSKLKSNTKQVYEKIMNRAITANALQSVRDDTISITTLKYILDQIEKGENN